MWVHAHDLGPIWSIPPACMAASICYWR
jgi:hypothetical protein